MVAACLIWKKAMPGNKMLMFAFVYNVSTLLYCVAAKTLVKHHEKVFQYIKMMYKIFIGVIFFYLYSENPIKLVSGFIPFYIFSDIIAISFREEKIFHPHESKEKAHNL